MSKTTAKILAPLSNVLWLTCAIYALYYLAAYIYVALHRINYPFELEWMEGGMVDHVRWILAEHKLYAEPSMSFTAFIYPPLYFYASAALSHIAGISFLPLRLLSFTSSLAVFAILFFWVKKETRQVYLGILSAGLYAATFPLSGFWFDIARVDSLFLALLLGCLYTVRFGRGTLSIFIASLLFLLAWLTKQIGLLVAAPIAFYLFAVHAKRCFFFILTTALTTLPAYFFMNQYFDGWFNYYLFEIPRGHDIYPQFFSIFWLNDIAWPLGIACAFSLIFLISLFFQKGKAKLLFYWLLACGLMAIGCSSRMHSQAYSNVLFPAYAAISLLAPMGIRLVKRRTSRIYNQLLSPVFAGLLLLLQFSRLGYPPASQIPAERSRQQGTELIQWLKTLPGDVLIPYHGQLAAAAGKTPSAHAMAIFDVIRVPDHSGAKLMHEYRQAVSQRQFSAIITNEWDGFLLFTRELNQYYGKRLKLFPELYFFYPVTGSSFKPYKVSFPKNSLLDNQYKSGPIIATNGRIENHPR